MREAAKTEIVEATLLGLIIFIASIVVAAAIIFFVCYLLFWLFQLFPTGWADKIGAVLDNLLRVAFGMVALVVFLVVCYQIGVDFLK
mgnify:CR=1 FL=1